MRIGVLLLTAAGFALAGCTTPLVAPDLPSFQHKMSNERDWDSLASRTAGAFASGLDRQNPVFIVPGPSDMPFAVGFHNLLQKEFLERGIPVDENAAGAIVLSFEVQTFKYRSPRDKSLLDYASFWSIVGAGASQARKITSPDTAAAAGAGIGPVQDLLVSLFDGTKAEVVVTLTARNGTRVVYRDMRTFFVQPTELPLYWTGMGDFVPQAKVASVPDTPLEIRPGR